MVYTSFFSQLEGEFPVFMGFLWAKDQEACLSCMNESPRLVLGVTGLVKHLSLREIREHRTAIMQLTSLLEQYVYDRL